MTIGEAIKFIAESHGRIYSIRFQKRGSQQIRYMRCKTYVKDAIKGEGQAYNPADYLLVNVYDMDAKRYKSFPIDGLKEILINGEWHQLEATQQ